MYRRILPIIGSNKRLFSSNKNNIDTLGLTGFPEFIGAIAGIGFFASCIIYNNIKTKIKNYKEQKKNDNPRDI